MGMSRPDGTVCENGSAQYWIAWGHSTLRFGLGLVPGQRDVLGASFTYNTQTDLWLRVTSDYARTTNWTIYRTANFSGKSVLTRKPFDLDKTSD